MPPVRRRRCFLDRFNSSAPPSLPGYQAIPLDLRPHISIRDRLAALLDIAFPPLNARTPKAPTLSTFTRAVTDVEGPLAILISPLERTDSIDREYVRLSAEAQIPALLVDMLDRMLFYHSIAFMPPSSPEARQHTVRSYVSLMRNDAAVQSVETTIVVLLRAMNILTASELLSLRFAADKRLLPLLFSSMRCPEAVEVALALIEETLHASRRAADFDLSSVPYLPDLVMSLTPFHLGAFCRVLAPLVDERDIPLCGGDHCSGACSFSTVAPHHDWQQIEPSTKQLRHRRSYVGAKERVVRDRNHAVLLAIPGLLERLVKLLAVPPAPREELVMVDHALRHGDYTLNFDVGEVMVDAPQLNLRNAIFASIRADLEPGGEVVFHHVGPGEAAEHDGENGGRQGPDEQVRNRVLLMLFRRLTGLDNEDADMAGTQKWEVLEDRIARSVVDYSNGNRENGIFRERRRHFSPPDLSVDTASPGEAHAQNEIATGGNVQASGVQGNQPITLPATQDTGIETNGAQAVGGTGWDIRAEVNGQQVDDATSPQISINGLLMSSHQVEVLFVLYSLLIGRRKSEVQAALIDAHIFSVLGRFCDALDWNESPNETKTEESLKVHFIRLLHYMCDGLGGNFPMGRVEFLFADHERALLQSIDEGKMPKLNGFGSCLTTPIPFCSQDPVLGLQSLSLNPRPPVTNPTPSLSVHREREASQSHFHCSPIRPDNISHLLGDVAADHTLSSKTDETAKKEVSSFFKAASPKSVNQRAPPLQTSQKDQSPLSEPGIICKVASILIKTSGSEEEESTRRHLLSGCIETFLRTASVSEKTLMAHKGLLVHLVKQLSESTNMSSHVSQFRQTSFDLLGQLVKWNRELFNCMNEMFHASPKVLSLLLGAVSDRLIDSNVFVRSVVMSLERFRAEDEVERVTNSQGESYVPYDFENCLLWRFVETYRVQLIHDLFLSVRVEDVNFENICCVNTTLILLVTTCVDEDSLDLVLEKIADMVIENVASGAKAPESLHALDPMDIFDNFKKLADFWMSYYKYQGLDVASQEISSNIHFDRLVTMATWLQQRLTGLSERVRREVSSIPLEQ